ncbi:MAG: hypothetical protein LBS42_05790 [Tannerella sp.]|nr:hypothetical protein [Tannerella sp.]
MKTVIHLLGRKRQKTIAALFILGIALVMFPAKVMAQVTTTVDITTVGTNPYVIAPGSGDYIFKGHGTQTVNRINVQNGYDGTITLDSVNIVCPINLAPMRIFGTFNGDNNNPTTKVRLILKGNNFLNSGNGANSVAAGLQVDQGAQIDISAIDPSNNASGYLKADTRNTDMSIAGAAGIGGSCVQNTLGDANSTGTYIGTCPEYNGFYMRAGTASTAGGNRRTTGGNIIITSGTIVAQGGNCGAGIGGGGWQGLYTGNIVITGGDVTATGGVHSPGIGGGCDNGSGNIGSYVPNSCVIAVPPAKITANTPNAGKGLSGANYIVYIGDPQSPQFTVYTEDYRATTMYLDLSGDPDVKRKLEQFAPTRDPERMYLGESKVYPADGLTLWNPEFAGKNIVQNYGTFTGNITFFTDAKNDKGFEYVPETRTMTPNIKVKLNAPVYDPVMTMTKYVPPIGAVAPMDTADLLLGYNATEAIAKAVTLTFSNNGNTKLYNMEIELTAPYHTAEDGTSLDAKIQAALLGVLTTDASGTYLAPGAQFQVKARLNTDLGVGAYTGSVRFNADNVPAFVTKSQTFTVNVVRIMLPPPVLDTAPSGIDETNGSFVVEATFVRPVSGLTNSDIQSTGGTVSGMAPVGVSPSDKWRFTTTPEALLTNGQYIQLYAKEDIAYDDHLIRTDDRSNALNVKYNTDKPYATFDFTYDIAADSVFITSQNSFTFTVNANGSSGADIDSLWEDTGTLYMNASLAVPVVSIQKDGVPYADWSVTAYEWNAAAGAHVVTVTGTPSAFGEGDYKITLASGKIRNNVGNTMDEKISGFKVRIPTIIPGPNYPGLNIGYGIEPNPILLPYQGGNVLLTVYGTNLQYAEAMGILKIQLPAAILNGIQVAPHAAIDGLTATITVPAPGNNTVTPVIHPFTLLLNDAMPDPYAIGYTTVDAAPAIVVDPVDGKWFGICEYVFTATIPDDGADREVNLTYLGLAKDYLAMQGGVRPPAKVTLRGGETQLYLTLKTLQVPDNLNGGTGAIVVSSPGLPSDTSAWFQFYNIPNVDNMVYIPPTTMYPGKLELNIKGGSPNLERSFDDVTWESAWLQVTPSQIANLTGIIYFREPDGCDEDMHFPIRGFFNDTINIDPQIVREIQILSIPNVITAPAAGTQHVNSGEDFILTVTLTGPYSGMLPAVSTSRRLLSDEEGITIVPLGNDIFSITVHAVREHFSVSITATEADPGQGVEEVDIPRVWTSEGQVHIYATHSGEARIYTLTGALVKNFALAAGKTNSTSLNAGFYVVVTLDNGKRYKIVIR